MKLRRADIQFYRGKELIKFSVYNNLPDTHGLSIQDAVDNWVVRTDTFTALSLCEYVMSKDESIVCMTTRQFNRMNKLGT